MQFVLKLDELVFKPLFAKALEWATLASVDARTKLSRGLVFFRLVDKMTAQLQNIFVPYFEHLVDSIIHVLSKLDEFVPSTKDKALRKAYHHESEQMLLYTISALHKVRAAPFLIL